MPSALVIPAWLCLGALVGAYGTLIGAGGGFVLVPVLLLIYPQASAEQVTAVSLAVVFANATSGSVGYYRLRRVDYRSGAVLALATLPGAILGALLVGFVPRHVFDLSMGVALLLIAGIVFFRPGAARNYGLRGRFVVARTLLDAGGVSYDYRFNLAYAAVASIGVGFLSSLLGIGGGIIHVPLLTSFFGFPAHVATATSHFVLMVMAGAATITHLARGDYSGYGLITASLAVGVILGAQLGAVLSERVGGRLLLRLLALGLGLVGLRLLLLGG